MQQAVIPYLMLIPTSVWTRMLKGYSMYVQNLKKYKNMNLEVIHIVYYM